MLTPPRGCDRPPTWPSIGYVSSPIRARYEPYSIWVVVAQMGRDHLVEDLAQHLLRDRLAVRHEVASKNIAASGHPTPHLGPPGSLGCALLRCLTADSAAGVRRGDRRPLLDRRSDGRSGRIAAAVRGRPAGQARSIPPQQASPSATPATGPVPDAAATAASRDPARQTDGLVDVRRRS